MEEHILLILGQCDFMSEIHVYNIFLQVVLHTALPIHKVYIVCVYVCLRARDLRN